MKFKNKLRLLSLFTTALLFVEVIYDFQIGFIAATVILNLILIIKLEMLEKQRHESKRRQARVIDLNERNN
jgi:hypothetical protein